VFTALAVQRSILWLFFSEYSGGLRPTVLYDVWIYGGTFGGVLSIGLWLAITRNTVQTAIIRFLVLLMLLGLLCNWILLYAVAYSYLGLIDNDKVVREPLTSLYFSVVTWTTLGYGDIRPSLETRLVAASEALLGYVWMGLFIGTLATLFKQPTDAAPRRVRTPWMWTLTFGHREDRTSTHGYETTREAAMAAVAKSWRRDQSDKLMSDVLRTYPPAVEPLPKPCEFVVAFGHHTRSLCAGRAT
jgi:Ion channel